MSTKGQIVLPAEFCAQDEVEPGQEFDVERLGPGVYKLTRRVRRANAGLVDWLLASPEKDWFTEFESASTDAL